MDQTTPNNQNLPVDQEPTNTNQPIDSQAQTNVVEPSPKAPTDTDEPITPKLTDAEAQIAAEALISSQKPPKPNRLKIVVPIITTMFVLAFAGIAVGVYHATHNISPTQEENTYEDESPSKKSSGGSTVITPTNPSDSSNSNNNSAEGQSESEVVSTIPEGQIKTLFDEIIPIIKKIYNVNYVIESEQFGPAIKLNDYDTLVTLENSYAIKSDSLEDDYQVAENVAKGIATTLEQKGFQYDEFINSHISPISRSPHYVNQETGIVCEVGNKMGTVVKCAEKGWISQESIALAGELTKATYETTGHYQFAFGLLNKLTVKDSPVTPYQKVEVPIDNAAGLYYRVSPNANWKYFTGTQDILGCDQYDTDELKNAYAGEKCWDNNSKTEITINPAE